MKHDLSVSMQWSDYFLKKNEEAIDFWKKYLEHTSKNILYILGKGFDPRMLNGLKSILKIKNSNNLECFLIEFVEGNSHSSADYLELTTKNYDEYKNMIPEMNRRSISINLWSEDDRPIGSKEASNIINDSDVSKYDDVIVDVSALPISIHFPLVGKLLSLAKTNNFNLHVIVSENSELDNLITDTSLDESASYMHKFTGGLGDTSTSTLPRIWIPIMGEGKTKQMLKIQELVTPDEINPIFPMPSVNPRKFEQILEEYGKWFFDTLRIDSRNFVFAAEQNPFEVYREIRKVAKHYIQTFGEKQVQIILSPLSNKLSSIGCLLAAYELKKLSVGIAHVETKGYKIDNISSLSNINKTELFTLWLMGDCYAKNS